MKHCNCILVSESCLVLPAGVRRIFEFASGTCQLGLERYGPVWCQGDASCHVSVDLLAARFCTTCRSGAETVHDVGHVSMAFSSSTFRNGCKRLPNWQLVSSRVALVVWGLHGPFIIIAVLG